MPAKRAASDRSDSEEAVSSLLLSGGQTASAAKRARFSDVRPTQDTAKTAEDEDDEGDIDELDEPEQETGSSRSNGKGMRLQVQEEDLQAEDEEGSEDEDGGKSDEEENAQVAKAAKSMSRQKGSIAEAGVIETITLKNFMCHAFFETHFNPQINFIIGHNGSGKSVILTGITFVFGAKAATTGRGKSLGELVTKGKTSAEVTVAIRNKGPEAFKPEKYGKKIYLTRRVAATGVSGYKLAGFDKKIVSKKREELSALCDHFNIQVDNPVNILSQDTAKVFLHSSKPQDKYTFFLKGTQLAQLTAEYNALYEQITGIQTIVKGKSARVHELEAKFKEAKHAWKEIEKVKGVEDQLRDIKNSLAWTIVQDTEKELQEHLDKAADQTIKGRNYEKAVKDAREKLDKILERINEAEKAVQDEEANDLDTELTALRAQIRQKTGEMQNVKSEIRTMDGNIKRLDEQIKSLDEQIEGARKLLDGSGREKADRARANLEKCDQQIRETQTTIGNKNSEKHKLDQDIARVREQQETTRVEIIGAKHAYERADATYKSYESQRRNPMSAFGPNTEQIIQAIERERGWIEKPIGPLGRYIKLKDAAYAKLAEAFFNQNINGYLTFNEDDRRRLAQIIRNCRGHQPTVYMTRYNGPLDVSHGEPDKRHTTMLDILSFTDPRVRNLMIDTMKIEGMVLVKEQRIGDALMFENKPEHTRITSCYDVDLHRIGGIFRGYRSFNIEDWRYAPRLSQDNEAQMQAALGERNRAEQNLKALNATERELQTNRNEWQAKHKQLLGEMGRMSVQLNKLSQRREVLLEETREEEPPNIRALEEAKEENKSEKENIHAQMAAANEQVQEMHRAMPPLVGRKEEIQGLLKQREEIRQNRQGVLEDLVRDRVKVNHHIEQYQGKAERQRKLTEEAEAVARAHEDKLKDALRDAKAICERDQADLTKNRSRKKLESMIQALEKALREREREVGGSAEEIHAKMIAAKRAYDDNRLLIQDLKNCLKDMQIARQIRMDRWVVFRNHIALRSRMLFSRHLHTRGFTGDLRFNHDEQKLLLRVEPNMDGKKSQRTKDSATLSGGEKSYATICLLLSLWEAAGSPIRGLDEFDVFMDPVNRKIATNLLIDAAKSANGTQMILISPNSFAGSIGLDGVKVIKIADPERGQGTLQTGA